MTTVLIITNSQDSDSFLVQEALARKGHQASLVQTNEFPQRSRQKVLCSNRHRTQWALASPELRWIDEVPDVVWWRRPVRPVLPDWLHPEDVDFAALECEFFQDSMWEALSRRGSFWVNPLQAARIADNKIVQQQLAIECGLETPPTLYSNDPKEIHFFIREMGGRAVYKPFRPFHANWLSSEGRRECLYTSVVDEGSLPEDDVLAVTPGIFQQLVDKAYELRAVIMGRNVFAFRIDTPAGSAGQLDWRAAYKEIRLRKVDLPPEIAAALLAVMDRLRIVTGSCDLIVTPSGETVFLEVNESGQFLWLEGYTEFPLLDAFCEFLIQHRQDFHWQTSPDCLRIADVGAAAERRWKRGLSPISV